ncbi:MAG: glutathione binding-like protein [Cognatishimia sp.]
MVTNIYEGILRRCYPHHFLSNENAHPQLIASANQRVHQAFQVLEAELKDRLAICGDELSIADLMFAMLYAWHNAKPELPRCTKLTERVATHPLIMPIWHRNFNQRLDHDWTATR